MYMYTMLEQCYINQMTGCLIICNAMRTYSTGEQGSQDMLNLHYFNILNGFRESTQMPSDLSIGILP